MEDSCGGKGAMTQEGDGLCRWGEDTNAVRIICGRGGADDEGVPGAHEAGRQGQMGNSRHD